MRDYAVERHPTGSVVSCRKREQRPSRKEARGKRFFREVSLPTRPRAIIGYLIAAELVPAGAGAMTANNRSLATLDHEP